jgi:hypothetical protein
MPARSAGSAGFFAAVGQPPDNPKAYGRRRAVKTSVASVCWVPKPCSIRGVYSRPGTGETVQLQ